SKIMAGIVFLVCLKVIISRPIVITIVKEKTSWINIPVCLQSEKLSIAQFLFYTLFLYSITDAFSNYIGHIILKSIWNDVSCA
ncbi:IS5/IS1182 family transposase, partial [Streptococcus agalactiae]|nr:IS5/IS1182 family transposase [Streptococcus agalactiae]